MQEDAEDRPFGGKARQHLIRTLAAILPIAVEPPHLPTGPGPSLPFQLELHSAPLVDQGPQGLSTPSGTARD
ncbi:uncharacterized protein N7482_003367 [Penicillium canariense]|uniref:Uncharacterized protein n=1 Tax=Penicillium canariense TaxID=189055 RepID=A0A9W9I6M8_9EURO|nr:uncharacterized protein N7482_003367 [Penicillium canariense]KAJ5167773.1 hypothetical protein N7482_003367 [Penicillium canariense]